MDEKKNKLIFLTCLKIKYNKKILYFCYSLFIFSSILSAILFYLHNNLVYLLFSIQLSIAIIIIFLTKSTLVSESIDKNDDIFNILFKLIESNKYFFNIKHDRMIKSMLWSSKNIKSAILKSKLNKDFYIQGSSAILLAEKYFWRNVNDIDLLSNEYIKNYEYKKYKSIKMKIEKWNYLKFEIEGFDFEILRTKILPNNFILKTSDIKMVNTDWQICMKICQLIQLLLQKKCKKTKLINCFIDLAWLYQFRNKNFINSNNLSNTIKYIFISNMFFYYHLKYKNRITVNINLIKLKMRNFLENDFNNEHLFKDFINFILNTDFIDNVIDKETISLVKSISWILKNKSVIWNEILDINIDNDLSSLNLVDSNLNGEFWLKWPEIFINIASILNFNTKDIRMFLLDKLLKREGKYVCTNSGTISKNRR